MLVFDAVFAFCTGKNASLVVDDAVQRKQVTDYDTARLRFVTA